MRQILIIFKFSLMSINLFERFQYFSYSHNSLNLKHFCRSFIDFSIPYQKSYAPPRREKYGNPAKLQKICWRKMMLLQKALIFATTVLNLDKNSNFLMNSIRKFHECYKPGINLNIIQFNSFRDRPCNYLALFASNSQNP